METVGLGATEASVDTDPYRAFAYLLGHPTPDRFDWLSKSVGIDSKGAEFESYEQYEASYIALFDVGVPEPPVPLLESYYHKAIPAQQTVLENSDFFGVLGLRPSTSALPPDHLVTQLEFLAAARYLQENCNPELDLQNLERLERDFLERHLLSWIPAALAKLEELNPPFFPACFALLLDFLRTRHHAVSPRD